MPRSAADNSVTAEVGGEMNWDSGSNRQPLVLYPEHDALDRSPFRVNLPPPKPCQFAGRVGGERTDERDGFFVKISLEKQLPFSFMASCESSTLIERVEIR